MPRPDGPHPDDDLRRIRELRLRAARDATGDYYVEGLRQVRVRLARSPGNLGTLLRTAEAAGAAGVVFLDRHTDPFDARVVRASMGGIFGLRLVRATHADLGRWVSRHGGEVVGAAPRGDVSYTEIPLRSPLVVLFGEERRGLTEQQLRLCARTAVIPMTGRADSLNLGVAAAVVLFDLRRRARDPAATLRPGG
jgi:RNA methyltransferase, TrmH family